MAIETRPPTGAPAPGHLKWVGLGALGVAAGVVVAGVLGRAHAERDVKGWTEAQAIPTVAYVTPTGAAAGGALSLPGTLQALNEAQLFARVPGYVHAWYKDIGAHVKKGEALALIDTPELDQQIAQARADLANATAARALSQTTAARWSQLLAADAVSKQEAEEKTGDLAAKTALVAASRANLDRLLAQKNFARITAPFDGVVTGRTAEIGALANAGTGGAPLFTVADISRIRAYVRVPQSYSAAIRPGLQVQLTLPEYPGRSFPAALDSTSNAISQQSGTLLVELVAANPGGALKPGAFAQASFALPKGASAAQGLPASTLIFRAKGLQVATVGANNHIHMKPVVIAEDLGPTVEIASALAPTDRVVDNPPDSLAEGDLVRIAGAQQTGAQRAAR